jgi:hypothetical protein
MTIVEHRVPAIIKRPVTRPIVSQLMTAPVTQVALMQLGANSWDGTAGRFTSSPWEGLCWEDDPPIKASFDQDVIFYESLGRFLMNIMYGE